MINIKKLWYRFKYRKQLKEGYGLLIDLGAKREFEIVNGKAFIMNGVDPLVRVDLSTSKSEVYTAPSKVLTYTYKIRANNELGKTKAQEITEKEE